MNECLGHRVEFPGERCPACILEIQLRDAKTAIELYESNFASLVDALNTELRENGPVDVNQAGINDDLRPFVRRLVDYVRARGDRTNKKRTTPMEASVGTGTHRYLGTEAPEFLTSDCSNGCGCWMGRHRSGGPDGVDPFGECPKAK